MFKYVIEDRHENLRMQINAHEGPLIHYRYSFDADEAREVSFRKHNGALRHGHSESKFISNDEILSKEHCRENDYLSTCVLYIGVECE